MNNPFTSNSFVNTWIKHFKDGMPEVNFNFINHVSFYKNKLLPVFTNVGRNLTKGVYYSINPDTKDYNGKVFLLYDIPEYFNVGEVDSKGELGCKEIFQYQGFLMDLKDFESADDYIRAQFNSKNRREFNGNIRKLETCFSIRYEFVHGSIERLQYTRIMNAFHELLKFRYDDKKVNFHLLNPREWNFYNELIFPMINEGKASFLIIYNEEIPIGITLNFHTDSILFESVTAFNPDYYKFSIGKTSIIKLIEWCLENAIQYSDFSKGDFNYKRKWGNVAYNFNYHILYDKSSVKASVLAGLIANYLKLKLYLRKKNINVIFRKIQFLLKSKKEVGEKLIDITTVESLNEVDFNKEIQVSDDSFSFLKKYVYTFLFANAQPLDELKIYANSKGNQFAICGRKKTQVFTFSI